MIEIAHLHLRKGAVMKSMRRVRVTAVALAAAVGGVFFAGTAPVHAKETWSQFRNAGNGLCMTTADDPANAFQGTATFAACDASDPRQQWRLELAHTPAWMIVSRSTNKCIADVAGWGLAWLGKCDANDIDQAWHFRSNDAGDLFWLSHDDGKLLSTPYREGTSYVTVRKDLAPEDPRYKWRLLP
ncbi:RICIN domain-containing protein [Streptomyces sp. NPDC005728]|uniref:RICIN domain-containing protein n=1 Tax=Streptomyces sp. NPDC005728 TaxID=3157054 RepID=UPI0033F10BD6